MNETTQAAVDNRKEYQPPECESYSALEHVRDKWGDKSSELVF